MILRYKVRENTFTDKKPRVYFCCHKDDFGKYFEEISNEILDLQNCVIWYKGETDAVNDELMFDLGQMQLFVMPVTSNLLCTENNALNKEFKFAIENRIPVLPLMQESGLAGLFNKKCGELQFLDKHNTPPDAIPYREKLEKYLSSVLTGDELAEKVRLEFDAYVFLSYRKKDRRLARELMQLIHKNDFCRDIAIWYDEFLSPGENFNDSIKAALEKSGLFVLAVTPNLVNETNYIMTTEYPMAKERNKPILPAELEATDKKQLSEKYEGIPDCTDAHNQNMLSKALLQAVNKMAKKENDTSPEHNYYIGLAYLGGIDVEIDYGRALELIMSAAESGLPEAVEKLVSMYTVGNGVECSFAKAAAWQERLVALYRERYEKNKNPQNIRTFGAQCVKLAEMYLSLRRYSDADRVLRITVALYDEAEFDSYIPLAYLLGSIGLVAAGEGKIQIAEYYLTKALKLIKGTTMSEKMIFAHLMQSVGVLEEKKGNALKAKEYYARSMEMFSRIQAEEPENASVNNSLLGLYINLAHYSYMEGNAAEAERYYQMALADAPRLKKNIYDVQAYTVLLLLYGDLCETATAEGDMAKAEEYCREELSISGFIAKAAQTDESNREMEVIANKLGDMVYQKGDLVQAEKWYTLAYDIAEELFAEKTLSEAERDLSVCCENMGKLFMKKGDNKTAEQYYRKCLALDEKQAKLTGAAEDLNQLAADCFNLSTALAVTGLFGTRTKKEKKELLQRAYDIWVKLSEKHPDVREYAKNRDIVKKYL